MDACLPAGPRRSGSVHVASSGRRGRLDRDGTSRRRRPCWDDGSHHRGARRHGRRSPCARSHRPVTPRAARTPGCSGVRRRPVLHLRLVLRTSASPDVRRRARRPRSDLCADLGGSRRRGAHDKVAGRGAGRRTSHCVLSVAGARRKRRPLTQPGCRNFDQAAASATWLLDPLENGNRSQKRNPATRLQNLDQTAASATWLSIRSRTATEIKTKPCNQVAETSIKQPRQQPGY
jgi:hypothetical protein